MLVETIRKEAKFVTHREVENSTGNKATAASRGHSIGKESRNQDIIVEGMQRVISLAKENLTL